MVHSFMSELMDSTWKDIQIENMENEKTYHQFRKSLLHCWNVHIDWKQIKSQ